MTENEIKERMESLLQKQQQCLKLQKLLIILTIGFFKYGVIPLFLHIAIVIIWGGILSNKATSLARKKYPYVRIGRVGIGASWDPFIIDEANRLNDNLTVQILKYNIWTLGHFACAMIGYCVMWIIAAALKLY